MWKRDSVYVLRVLSGIVGDPREGVMRERRVRNAEMSNSWSISIVVGREGMSLQVAVVMPFAIVTIEVQIVFVTSSLRSFLVIMGRTELRIEREDVVA